MHTGAARDLRRVATIGVVIDGAWGLRPPRADAFSPFLTDTLCMEPWPVGAAAAPALLDYLGRRHAARPLLALTARALADGDGTPLRGVSKLGSGLALASCCGLDVGAATGVMRHELAHALGLDHCERWDCALSERPHPLPVADRPSALCPACRQRWDRSCRELAP